jgi:methionine-rich copper-binding protein CopC
MTEEHCMNTGIRQHSVPLGRLSLRLAWPLAALLALLGVVAPAAAHARYDHSTPGQGEVVQASPARVDIFTAQDMKKDQALTAITVTDGNNSRVDTGDTTVDDANRRHFSVGLKPSLPAGRYAVSFKNASDEDGEQDNGQFAFYVGSGPTPQQKVLDGKLSITSKSDPGAKSSSHTGLIVAIVVAAVVLALIIAGALWYVRRPKRRI